MQIRSSNSFFSIFEVILSMFRAKLYGDFLASLAILAPALPSTFQAPRVIGDGAEDIGFNDRESYEVEFAWRFRHQRDPR